MGQLDLSCCAGGIITDMTSTG